MKPIQSFEDFVNETSERYEERKADARLANRLRAERARLIGIFGEANVSRTRNEMFTITIGDTVSTVMLGSWISGTGRNSSSSTAFSLNIGGSKVYGGSSSMQSGSYYDGIKLLSGMLK